MHAQTCKLLLIKGGIAYMGAWSWFTGTLVHVAEAYTHKLWSS